MMSLPDRLVLECPEHYSDMADQLDTEEEEGHQQTNGGTGGGKTRAANSPSAKVSNHGEIPTTTRALRHYAKWMLTPW